MSIVRPDQVWSTDITYIRMQRGFIYLVAIMDWFSRYVISWEVSTSLDPDFCVSALDWALATGRRPDIFNTDQGAQFTSKSFTDRLNHKSILISMDGRGRALDNVFVERLWRSVKYEEVYLNEYPTVDVAVDRLAAYFRFYNRERPHQGLGYQTPQEVYLSGADSAPGANNNPKTSNGPAGQSYSSASHHRHEFSAAWEIEQSDEVPSRLRQSTTPLHGEVPYCASGRPRRPEFSEA